MIPNLSEPQQQEPQDQQRRRQEQAEELLRYADQLKQVARDVCNFIWGLLSKLIILTINIISILINLLLFIYNQILAPLVVKLGTPLVNYVLSPFVEFIGKLFGKLIGFLWKHIFRPIAIWFRAVDNTYPLAKYILLGGITIYINVFANENIPEIIALESKINKQNHTIDSLKESITQDSLRLHSLTTPQGIERIARERYYMHAPGEEVYVIVPKAVKPVPKPSDSIEVSLAEAPVETPAEDPEEAQR